MKKKFKLKITDQDGSEVVAPKRPPQADIPLRLAAAATAEACASKKLEVVTSRPSAKEAEANEDAELVGQIIL